VDTNDGHTKFYKNKSFFFKVLEGIAKIDDQYQDVEENA
jgi:5-bromo-4-chloroindolyl phosphate hydrolysis protein